MTMPITALDELRSIDIEIAKMCGVTVSYRSPADQLTLWRKLGDVPNSVNEDWLERNQYITHDPFKRKGGSNYRTEADAWDSVEYFTTDANPALMLLAEMPSGAVFINDDGITWSSTAYLDGAGMLADESAETPALAICKAWLVWKQQAQATR